MRILVIDDDEVARELLSGILRGAGHETFELPSSIGMSQIIAKNQVDAVVLDVMLPNLSGDKIARLLRNRGGERLGIVLVSSRSTQEIMALADAVTADRVVSKRDVRQRLAKAVSEAVAYRSSMPQTRKAGRSGPSQL